MRTRQLWTPLGEQLLRELYPTTTTPKLVRWFNRPAQQIYNKAKAMGITKTPEYMKEHVRVLPAHVGEATRFPKGHVPLNKGKRLSEFMSAKGIERSSATRFKKGNVPHNTKYNGYVRRSKDGYIEVRVTMGRFRFAHHLVWEQYHGPVPKGCMVKFKDGNKENISIGNLYMTSRANNMIMNSHINLPPDLREILILKRVLTRFINKELKQHEQSNTE